MWRDRRLGTDEAVNQREAEPDFGREHPRTARRVCAGLSTGLHQNFSGRRISTVPMNMIMA